MAPAFSIAPALNSGTNSWSYLPNGYRRSNTFSKKAKPCRVTSMIASASRCSASEARQNTPSGITLPSSRRYSSRTTWYGPATSAVM